MTGVSATWMQLYWSGLDSPHPSKTMRAIGFPFGSLEWAGNSHENPELPIFQIYIKQNVDYKAIRSPEKLKQEIGFPHHKESCVKQMNSKSSQEMRKPWTTVGATKRTKKSECREKARKNKHQMRRWNCGKKRDRRAKSYSLKYQRRRISYLKSDWRKKDDGVAKEQKQPKRQGGAVRFL